MPRAVLPCRPHDRDAGVWETDTGFAVVTARPPNVLGRRDCWHPDHLELSFLTRGATYADVGGRQFVLRAGQYSVFSTEVEHSTQTRREGSAGLYLQLSKTFFDRAAAELGLRPWGQRFSEAHPIPEELAGVLTALRREVTASTTQDLMVESLTTYVAGALLREETRRPSALSPAGVEARLARTVEAMRADPSRPHRLADLAKEANLSTFRYAHVFKAQLGVAPHQLLKQLRLERAAEELSKTDRSVASVAASVGFSSGSRLAEAFRERYGVSPSEFRQQESYRGASKDRVAGGPKDG